MTMGDLVAVFEKYGAWAVLGLWMLDKFFPRFWTFVTEKVFPWKTRERARQLEQLEIVQAAKLEAERAVREGEATLLKAKIEREARMEEHQQKMDERMIAAQESTSQNIQQMALAITVNNERLSTLIANHSQHDSAQFQHNNFVVSAIRKMEDAVEKGKIDTEQKIKAIKEKR